MGYAEPVQVPEIDYWPPPPRESSNLSGPLSMSSAPPPVEMSRLCDSFVLHSLSNNDPLLLEGHGPAWQGAAAR